MVLYHALHYAFTRSNHKMSVAGLLAYSLFLTAFPLKCRAVAKDYQRHFLEITAAGTAPISHRIPSSW